MKRKEDENNFKKRLEARLYQEEESQENLLENEQGDKPSNLSERGKSPIDHLNESLSVKLFSNPSSNRTKNDLEEIVQKYEADIRMHIRIEQQMKIYQDNLKV